MAHFEQQTISRPTHFNFAKDVVDYWASKNQQAMVWLSQDGSKQRHLDYKHFSQQSSRIAVLLKQLGISKGDVLLMILPRLPQWWEINTACLRSGVIMCPATTLLVERDIEVRCQRSRAKVFVGTASIIQRFLKVHHNCPSVKVILQVPDKLVDDAIQAEGIINLERALEKIPENVVFTSPEIKSEDAAILFFTSGTSGPPKMVLHNAVSYPLAHTITGKRWLRLRPGKLYWNLSELGWAKAAWSFFSTWNCGAALFVYDDRNPFNANRVFDILHKYPITTLCAPPTAYRWMITKANQEYIKTHMPLRLEHCTGGGEPLNDEVVRVWRNMTGVDLCDGYGQTETILLCGSLEGLEIRPGSMGKPPPEVPLQVIDSEGKEIKVGAEGDIAILVGDSLKNDDFLGIFDGYIGDGFKAVRKTTTFEMEDGSRRTFYLTGDRATKDQDGYVWFVGRADDVINSAGYRIGPFEVESTLKLHPSVIESAAVSSPDKTRGEVVKAFVVLTEEYSKSDHAQLAKELQEFCKKASAPYKYPRKIQFVDATFLPKTFSGKIKRNELKKMEWQKVASKL